MDFLGVPLDVLDTERLLKRVIRLIEGETQATVMYVNADCMLQSFHDESYRRVLNRRDLVHADGVGVVWGARLWGTRIPARSTGADFMPEFCRTFAAHGRRLFT